MVCTLSMQGMNGICWQRKNFRKRSATTDIFSWKTAWECFVFYTMSSRRHTVSFREIKERRSFQSQQAGLPYPYLCGIAGRIREKYPNVNIRVYAVRNDFFGERITVFRAGDSAGYYRPAEGEKNWAAGFSSRAVCSRRMRMYFWMIIR